MGFDFMFNIFPILFFVVFAIVIGIFIFAVVENVRQWSKNNNSPRLTVAATIVAKRQDVSHHRHANAGDISGAHGYHTSSSTYYYITFQVESGDRMELRVNGNEFGLLAEGDRGSLSFQGTRYLGFVRNV